MHRTQQPGAVMSERADLGEKRTTVRYESCSDNRRDIVLQSIDAWIGVHPAVRQCPGIERSHEIPNLVDLEQPGAFRNQQADGELNRRDVIDEVELLDDVEQVRQ